VTAPRIPVYRPDLSGNEHAYVLECLETSWISSIGPFIPKFENAIAVATGTRHAIAVCNGTVALHLALHCLGMREGDEVIVPTLTYISSVNTVVQTGATPVFADARSSDWNLDPADVVRRITSRTKAIVAVHLYGTACDMLSLKTIADSKNIAIIEDCAEALGTTIDGRHVGTFGIAGTFSFFGNKTVTTGEGGMVVTSDDNLAALLRLVKGQGQSLTRRYWHEVLGFNYRMTNIEAAIGLAQVERLPEILTRKRAIARRYRELLADSGVVFQTTADAVVSSDWLVTILLPKGADRERVAEHMARLGVETRPTFQCAHQMPMYDTGQTFQIAQDIAARGMSLPSYPTLTEEEIRRTVEALIGGLRSSR
jgi:perosamine synthetase